MASNAKNLAEYLNNQTTSATADIADGSITTAKPANDAVTNDKVANNAINTDQIVNSAVTAAKQSGSQVPSFATGGTVTEYSSGGTNYRVHTFTSAATSQISFTGSKVIDYMILGGGGGDVGEWCGRWERARGGGGERVGARERVVRRG